MVAPDVIHILKIVYRKSGDRAIGKSQGSLGLAGDVFVTPARAVVKQLVNAIVAGDVESMDCIVRGCQECGNSGLSVRYGAEGVGVGPRARIGELVDLLRRGRQGGH